MKNINTPDYWDSRYKKGDYHSANQDNLERFRQAASFCQGKKILDLACGEGALTNTLAEMNFDAVGVDFSETGLAKARCGRAEPDIRFKSIGKFVFGQAEALPFQNKAFDTVCACEILEHVTNLEKVITEILRVLKPDSRIVITVPQYKAIPDPEHIRDFKQEDLDKLFSPLRLLHHEDLPCNHVLAVYGCLNKINETL